MDIVLVASYLTSSTPPVSSPPSSSTSYSLCRIVLLPAVSVPLRAVLTISRSSTIFSTRLFGDSHCRQHPRRHRHRHRTRRVLLDNHAAGFLIDIVLVASYSTTFPCVCPSESCANNQEARRPSRRGLFAIVPAAGILIGMYSLMSFSVHRAFSANCLCFCPAERCYPR